jgi:fumarate reductase subunit C
MAEPTPYPRQRSKTWFVKRWPYQLFMLRELSAVFLAAYMVLLLVLVTQVHNGRHSVRSFENTLKSPWLLIFTSVALIFALLHTITWFQAVPNALPLRRGENKVPAGLLIGAHYVAMLVLSAIVLVIVLV